MKNKRLVKLQDCPHGLFVRNDTLCVKTEYGVESYIVWSGETFCGGVNTEEELRDIPVLPVPDKVVQKIERKYGKRYKRRMICHDISTLKN